jgi:hypothetical protein
MLLASVLALSLRPGQHQSHSAAIEKGKRRRRIEEVRQSERVPIKPRGFLHVAHGHRDLLYALEG